MSFILLAIGFNVESLTYKNVTLNVWDLGGQTTIRPYWRCYYADTNAIIFVVDSADTERLGTACEELHQMLQEEELRDAALLIFANKQDLPGALSEAAVSEKMKVRKKKEDGERKRRMEVLFSSFLLFFLACSTQGTSLGNLQSQRREGRGPGDWT